MIMADFLDKDWNFSAPQSITVLTTEQVISAKKPILSVCHDDEGEWQFRTGTDVNMEDARVVALSEIVKRDRSIFDLADLPTGWIATRRNQDDDWQRFKNVGITADL
jgi:hypothetical protein